MACPRMAAGALFFDEADRVLLVEPSYKDYRDIPGRLCRGGGVAPASLCAEDQEELGIAPYMGRLLVVDWAPNPGEGDKALYLFDGDRLSADDCRQIALQADELRGYDFHNADQVADITTPRLARRIVAAIQARAADQTVYLETGICQRWGPDQSAATET
ncbi:NUDIX hydrolase [Streptomyces sp. WAC 06783]|nr:NUDIX hydrolase [Streptomyces sp. WAC 06783]